MVQNAVFRARISEEVKNEAASVLAEMGLTVSEACRMFLTRVAKEKNLPFDIHIPNEETIEAMKELEEGGGTRYSSPEEFFKAMGL